MGRTHRRRKKPDLADVAVPIAVLIALFFSKHLLGLVLTAIGVFLIPIAIFVWLRYTKANSAVTILPVIFSTTGAKAWSIDLLKSLDWKRFEELCLWYFQETGYHAAMASFGPDGGVDITLYESADPTKVLGIVQCKAWTQKAVGVKEIRELFGIMADKGCPHGIFVAISGFTPDAQAFASNKSIDLVSATQLLDLIAVLPAEIQSRLLNKTTQGDYTVPSCPSCGIKLVLRTVSKGFRVGEQFWGCQNYPRCKYVMNIKS